MNKSFLLFCSMDGIRQRFIISPNTCRLEKVWMSLCTINCGCCLIQKLILCYYSFLFDNNKKLEESPSCFAHLIYLRLRNISLALFIIWNTQEPFFSSTGLTGEMLASTLSSTHCCTQPTILHKVQNMHLMGTEAGIIIHKWTFYSRIHLPKCFPEIWKDIIFRSS